MAIGDFNPLPKISARADAAVVPFIFLKNTSSAQENLTAAIWTTGTNILGITADGAPSAGIVPIASEGEGRLTVNGSGTAIVAGDYLKPVTATGWAVKADTDKDAYGAQALEPSTASGDIIRVKIVQGYLSI